MPRIHMQITARTRRYLYACVLALVWLNMRAYKYTAIKTLKVGNPKSCGLLSLQKQSVPPNAYTTTTSINRQRFVIPQRKVAKRAGYGDTERQLCETRWRHL